MYSNDTGISIWCFLLNKDKTTVQLQLHIVTRYHACTCVVTWKELQYVTLRGCMSHIHVQHCHAWPACTWLFHSGYSSEVTSHSHACFHCVNSFARSNYVCRCAQETLELTSTETNFEYMILHISSSVKSKLMSH